MSIPPRHVQCPPNAPIQLSAGDTLQVRYKGKVVSGTGSTELRFFPNPGIYVQGTFSSPDAFDLSWILSSHPNESTLKLNTKKVYGFGTRYEGRTLDWVIGHNRFYPRSFPNRKITEIKFSLFNFPGFLTRRGPTVRNGSLIYRIFMLTLSDGSLVTRLYSIPETEERLKKLKREGGYSVTHWGSITKADGRHFLLREIEKILYNLRYFFSFVNASPQRPVLPMGYDRKGSDLWHSWNTPNCNAGLSSFSWFHTHYGNDLEALYPGFAGLLNHVVWGKSLREAVQFYEIASNPASGVEFGLILLLSILERLSFTHFVETREIVPANDFRNPRLWPLEKKINDLLKDYGISCGIPVNVARVIPRSTLSGHFRSAGHVLADVRNEIVHPIHGLKGKLSNRLYFESWKLAQWFIEMIIFRLCCYRGHYYNKLRNKLDVVT